MQTFLIDGNNLGFAGMATARLSAGGRDTQAIFSVIKRIQNITASNPDGRLIILWDGRSWRKDIYTEYKANREKTEKQTEARSDYYEQQKEIRRGLKLLGVRQLWATNYEADDMAAILSKSFSEKGETVTLLSADHDWQQLVNDKVTWIDLINDKRCDKHNFQAQTGYRNTAQFIEAKCILGDRGDNIFGINGIGEKTLAKLYERYDYFEDFLVAGKTVREEAWPKMPKVLRELDTKGAFQKLHENHKLVDLHTKARPKADKIIDEKGKLDEIGFTEFCYENAFLSITKRMDSFILPFKENIYVNRT